MSWLYSRALVEEYSAGNCLAGEQSAPSKSSHIPQAFLPSDKMTVYSRLSQYGMTFAHLTDDLGEELLTWYLEGFHARTLAVQGKALESTEREADSGKKWRGLLVRYGQDLVSSKTVLCSEQEDYQRFSKTLPKSGMMQDGECSELAMSERRTKETGCGYWPTPKHGDWRSGCQRRQFNTMLNVEVFRRNGIYPSGNKQAKHPQLNPCWIEALMGWPIGWTELKVLGMDKFQQWLDSHGKL